MYRTLLLVLLLAPLLLTGPARATASDPLPAPLEPWRQWVLEEHPELHCPARYDQGEERHCAWPSRLQLTLDEQGGHFSQQWQIYEEGYLPLPGGRGQWPQAVTVDGVGRPVVARQGRPTVQLPPGQHQVAGQFRWARLPELLSLPPESALIDLTLAGSPVAQPRIEPDGRLWLRPREQESGAPERLELQVFRHIDDDIPLRLTTLLRLEISGQPREVVLGPLFAAPFIPLDLSSPLPARLEPDGRLRLQVRPGSWQIRAVARHPGPAQQITRPAAPPPWPQEEVWVFSAQPSLRRVEVSGAPTIDPNLTRLPAEWRELPSYLLPPGAALTLNEQERGDPQPEADRLTLERSLLLDFDGAGFTLHDRIHGTLHRADRLDLLPPAHLGRVSVDGEAQLVTRGPNGAGIEARPGPLALEGTGRIEQRPTTLPLTGWNRDFDQVTLHLELPPGWSLLAATGPNTFSAHWYDRWTLLDLFLTLVIAIATARLWHWSAGLLALAALGLSWYTPFVPHWLWLYLLATIALRRALPAGRLQRLLGLLRGAGLLLLAGWLLLFTLAQMRQALYPQLPELTTMTNNYSPLAPPIAARALPAEAAPEPLMEKRASIPGRLNAMTMPPSADSIDSSLPQSPAPVPPPPRKLATYDPEAQIQTGPGLPQWQWHSYDLAIPSPVNQAATLTLQLLPPWVNRLLALLQLLLVLALGARLAELPPWRPRTTGAMPLLLGLLLLTGGPQGPQPAVAAEFPPAELLDQLETRLTRPPECLPECVALAQLRLSASPNAITLELEIHNDALLAIPLPLHPAEWLPTTISVDGEPARALARNADGGLWVALPPGIHRLHLSGPPPARPEFSLPLPLPPARVEVDAEHYSVEGVRPDGSAEGQLLLRAERGSSGAAQALEPTPIPPFLRVERTLRLGLEWRVENRISRLSPADSGIALRVPLLPGESVVDDNVRSEAGTALIQLGIGQRQLSWQSTLNRVDQLTLTASQHHDWSEVWRIEVSPIWHWTASGLPPSKRADPAALPEWQPWPGESLHLTIDRPAAQVGPTVTVEQVELALTPGADTTHGHLSASLRSSRGGHHTLRLPAGATLQGITLDGEPQPIPTGHEVTLPLRPATQTLSLDWREARGMEGHFTTSEVDLGAAGANARLQLTLPEGRWLIWTSGPLLGPVVLFWGTLLLTAVAALLASRWRALPLHYGHWLLLGAGLLQAAPLTLLPVLLWLATLALRRRLADGSAPWRLALLQLLLPLLTIGALLALLYAIQHGLLAYPDMLVSGNGSSGHWLAWYQDRFTSQLPTATAITLPLWVFRLLMLGWALWLAFALIRWLRWGWESYTLGGLWPPLPWQRRKPANP